MFSRSGYRRLIRWLQRRRLKAQQDSVHTRLMQVCVRLDEARRYVDRDRAVERLERDRLIQQRRLAREALADMEELVRASIVGQSLLKAELTATRAREVLDSNFGALDG